MIAWLKEFWSFLRAHKKLWLVPLILVLVVLGALLLFVQGTAVAPFIYTLF